jgi:hypothetical protein
MTPHRGNFVQYTPAAKASSCYPTSVQVADGSSADVVGVGTVHVWTVVNGTVMKHGLNSVLHVPGLEQSLFSVSRFVGAATKGPRQVFLDVRDDVCEITCRPVSQPESELKVFAQAELRDGLYWIRGVSEAWEGVPVAAAAADLRGLQQVLERLPLWQLRLLSLRSVMWLSCGTGG